MRIWTMLLVMRLFSRWYILAFALLAALTRIIFPSIPKTIPVIFLAVWLAFAIIPATILYFRLPLEGGHHGNMMNGNNFNNEEVNQVLETFAEKTKQPAVKLKPVRRETTVYDSKFGGTPYLPPGFSYPCDTYPGKGRPLVLLAQLNFAELPRLEGFPEHGILQFYCSDDDEFGANYGVVKEQSGFKVVYHEDIITDEKLLGSLPVGAVPSGSSFPFKGEFALEASIEDSVPFSGDYRFKEILSRFIQDNPSYAIIRDLEDFVEEFVNERATGSRIGGYPHFCQWDPRTRSAEEGYTILLLQIDSEGWREDGWWKDKEKSMNVILWGDAGVANFFITPEDLARLDFSRLIFSWDCS